MQAWQVNTNINSDGFFAVVVTATARDGSGVSGNRTVYLSPPTDRMRVADGWGRTGPFWMWQGDGGPLRIRQERIGNVQWGNFWGDYRVTSSNPSVLAIDNNTGRKGWEEPNTFNVIGLRPGRATVRVISNDGTNRSATVSFEVRARR
jgi:hypothetical protein